MNSDRAIICLVMYFSIGDYCFIDWMSLSLKTSNKSPMHPDFMEAKDPSDDSASDPNLSATSNAAANGFSNSVHSGN